MAQNGESTTVKLDINNRIYQVAVEPQWTLSYVLREKLGLTGTKQACGNGECGNCTVLIDGRPVLSCLTLAGECEGEEQGDRVVGAATGEQQ